MTGLRPADPEARSVMTAAAVVHAGREGVITMEAGSRGGDVTQASARGEQQVENGEAAAAAIAALNTVVGDEIVVGMGPPVRQAHNHQKRRIGRATARMFVSEAVPHPPLASVPLAECPPTSPRCPSQRPRMPLSLPSS